MKLEDQQASGNVEDRRGMGMVGGGLGVGGLVVPEQEFPDSGIGFGIRYRMSASARNEPGIRRS